MHNPTGEGVRAVSSELKKKTEKLTAKETHEEDNHDTKVKEVGSSRRNITRKKSSDFSYNNKNKKQGGAG